MHRLRRESLQRIFDRGNSCAAAAAGTDQSVERRNSRGLSGLDRLDFGALDRWGLDARRYFYRAGPLRRLQRTWVGHRPCQQHLRRALMMEIAIGEAHARDRSAEAALVSLVKIEAGLERNALDRRADGLAADLKRIARQPQVSNRT